MTPVDSKVSSIHEEIITMRKRLVELETLRDGYEAVWVYESTAEDQLIQVQRELDEALLTIKHRDIYINKLEEQLDQYEKYMYSE